MITFTNGEFVLRNMGVTHMHRAWQRIAESAPVIDHARKRDTAKIHAMIGALARHKHLPVALATNAMIVQRHLHRRLDRFGTGIHEEDPIKPFRHHGRNLVGKLKRLVVTSEKTRGEVEFRKLLVNGFRNLAPAMPRRRRKQTR